MKHLTWMIFPLMMLLGLGCRIKQPVVHPQAGWQTLTDFGANPGQLNAYVYVPASAPARPAIVVVLHGCGQNASDFARLTGWNDLADDRGVVVLYPEQQAGNNAQKCFNWFVPADVARIGGEVHSIRAMVGALGERMGADTTRVFVTGFSAGGAMTVALLAAYPDLFVAGAPVAGLPAGAAVDLTTGLAAMGGKVTHTPAEWAELVKASHPGYTGRWPRLLAVQGATDPIVSAVNAREMLKQWTALHQLDFEAGPQVSDNAIDGAIQRTHEAWRPPASRQELVGHYTLSAWGHAYPVHPGPGQQQGGYTDAWTLDAGWFATYWIADFFGLTR